MQPEAGKSSLADAAALPAEAKIAVMGGNQRARPSRGTTRDTPKPPAKSLKQSDATRELSGSFPAGA
jgi:hypothetical protein